jgi:integrase
MALAKAQQLDNIAVICQLLQIWRTKMATETATGKNRGDVRYWQKRLFKFVRHADGKQYEDGNWSVRISYEGRREQFQLKTALKSEAARKAARIYRRLVLTDWPTVLAEFKSKGSAIKATDVTIGEFLTELRSFHASKTRTIDTYAGSLRRIAADIAGMPSGGSGGAPESHRIWREKVETLKLSILVPAKVQKWKEAFLCAAGNDPVRQRAARVSVNSFLREARSLFSPRYLEKLDSIVLPAPLPFTGIKLEKRSMARYQSNFDVLGLVKTACDELANSEPEQFKVFVLAVMSGLRRNEIDKLEWSRFNWSAGTINIAPTEFFRTKSEDSARVVWIPPQMVETFRGYYARATGRFVIESEVSPILNKPYDHYRCQTLFERLIAWLRFRGVGGTKPLHTLRKEFGSLIAAKFGIYAAKEMLGHADIATTAAHYLEAKEKPVIGLGYLLPTNVVSMMNEKVVSVR